MSSTKTERLRNGDTRETKKWNNGRQTIVTSRPGLFFKNVKSVEHRGPPAKRK